jgi:hypothetical protein
MTVKCMLLHPSNVTHSTSTASCCIWCRSSAGTAALKRLHSNHYNAATLPMVRSSCCCCLGSCCGCCCNALIEPRSEGQVTPVLLGPGSTLQYNRQYSTATQRQYTQCIRRLPAKLQMSGDTKATRTFSAVSKPLLQREVGSHTHNWHTHRKWLRKKTHRLHLSSNLHRQVVRHEQETAGSSCREQTHLCSLQPAVDGSQSCTAHRHTARSTHRQQPITAVHVGLCSLTTLC